MKIKNDMLLLNDYTEYFNIKKFYNDNEKWAVAYTYF